MDRKAFRKLIRQNPAIKNWIMTNGEWFAENPQTIRMMLENPAILPSFNDALLRKKRTLYRRMKSLEGRSKKRPASSVSTAKAVTPSRPFLKLPSLSTLNERLSQTTEFLDGIQSVMDHVKKYEKPAT